MVLVQTSTLFYPYCLCSKCPHLYLCFIVIFILSLVFVIYTPTHFILVLMVLDQILIIHSVCYKGQDLFLGSALIDNVSDTIYFLQCERS